MDFHFSRRHSLHPRAPMDQPRKLPVCADRSRGERILMQASRLGSHRLLRPLGRGGMGDVYLSEDTKTHRYVALKIVRKAPPDSFSAAQRDNAKNRFLREIQTVGRLDHPNIVPIYSADQIGDIAYFTMKWIEGLDLRHLIDRLADQRTAQQVPVSRQQIQDTLANRDEQMDLSLDAAQTRQILAASARAPVDEEGSATVGLVEHETASICASAEDDRKLSETILGLPPAEASQSTINLVSRSRRGQSVALTGDAMSFLAMQMADVADAIAYANAQGILHRDIKPGNLIMDLSGKIYVGDFGLAKARQSDELQSTELLDSSVCVGTRGYIAPERISGDPALDDRSDVYSLGRVLQQLYTLGLSVERLGVCPRSGRINNDHRCSHGR